MDRVPSQREPGPRAGELSADVGKRIREARLERGMSLAQVGGDELSRSFLSLVENGRSRISVRALAIVADRLEMPISYFLQGETASIDVVELVVDRAELAVKLSQPDDALLLLQDVDAPPAMRPRFLWVRGWALSECGRLHDAITTLREALASAERLGDSFLRVHILHGLGAALYRVGVHDEALNYLQQALRSAEELEYPEIVGNSSALIGTILCARGESDDATAYYGHAREMLLLRTDADTLPSQYMALSAAYEKKGDYRRALHFSKRTLGMIDVQHSWLKAARGLNDIAIREMEHGDWERARTDAAGAVKLAERAGARQVEALARATLAGVDMSERHLDAAAEGARLAVDLADSDDDPARIAGWRILGALAEAEGKCDEADDLYGRALDALQRTGRQAGFRQAAVEYSKLLQQRGDLEQALSYAMHAAQVSVAADTEQ